MALGGNPRPPDIDQKASRQYKKSQSPAERLVLKPTALLSPLRRRRWWRCRRPHCGKRSSASAGAIERCGVAGVSAKRRRRTGWRGARKRS